MSKTKRAIFALILILGTCALILLFLQVGGWLLFLAYKQNPAPATLSTLFKAWAGYSDGLSHKKVFGATLISAILVLGVPLTLLMTMRKKPDKFHGAAKFATEKDLKDDNLLSKSGILLGKFNDKHIRLGGYEFVLLAAPTRTGKGVGFVIPNLLTYEDSVVVLDIKGENYTLTSHFRKQHLLNEVFYFNPFSEDSHRWNPLSYVSTDPRYAASDLSSIAAVIYPDTEKDKFWNAAARNLFVGLGLMLIESKHLPVTLGEMLRQASGKGFPIGEYLVKVIDTQKASGTPFSSTCTDYLHRFTAISDTVQKNILVTLTAPLSQWGNPVVDKATSTNDFDLRDVRRKKMSIYVHIPAGEIVQAGFVINLFFAQLINENVKTLPEHDSSLTHHCLLMLDEFVAAGRIEIIAKGVGYMAGYGLRLALIVQDKSQFESVYGKADAANIIGNMGAVIYFTPSSVKEAEEYSKMIGDDTIEKSNTQHSNVGGLNHGRYSVSETVSQERRALMLPQELRMLSKDKQLIARAGMAIAMTDKLKYFDDPFFTQRLNAVPRKEIKIQGQLRSMPVALPLPVADWSAYNSQISRSDHYLTSNWDPSFDLDTDLLLLQINSDQTTPTEMTQCIDKLVNAKLAEWIAELDNVPAASPADIAAFESV